MTARCGAQQGRAWIVKLFFCVPMLFGSVPITQAGDGGLDPSFGVDGKVLTDFNSTDDFLSRVAVQSDGKIVAIGYNSANFSFPRYALARYNPDGTLDLTFGPGGKVTTVLSARRERASGLLILPDGKIVI